MVELKDMTREELLGVIDIKDMRIKELTEEVALLKDLLASYVDQMRRDKVE